MDIYIPVGLKLIFLDGSHHIELAPTATAAINLKNRYQFEGSDSFLHLQMGMGYRFQSNRSPIYAFAHFSPGIMLDPTRTQISESAPEAQARIGLGLGIKI